MKISMTLYIEMAKKPLISIEAHNGGVIGPLSPDLRAMEVGSIVGGPTGTPSLPRQV